MKKKIMAAIAAGIIIAAAAGGYDTFAASAQTMRSRGNMMSDGGRMRIYSSDIRYLQTELEDLIRELQAYTENEKEEDAYDENQ